MAFGDTEVEGGWVSVCFSAVAVILLNVKKAVEPC